jgi:hypothetical protein
MPKKNRRPTTKDIQRSVAPTSNASSKPFEFNPDYSYVVKDLRTIGILAGTFVAAIVILSFFIN